LLVIAVKNNLIWEDLDSRICSDFPYGYLDICVDDVPTPAVSPVGGGSASAPSSYFEFCESDNIVANGYSLDYDIVYVEINNVKSNIVRHKRLNVDPGETLDFNVVIEGDDDISGVSVDDMRVKVEIEGYNENIEARTSIFEIEEGLTYHKRLSLVVPEDIDGSQVYTLRVEVSNQDEEETWEIPLHVNDLDLNILNPDEGDPRKIGSNLEVRFDVENKGIEKNVIVEALLYNTDKHTEVDITELEPMLISQNNYYDESIRIEIPRDNTLLQDDEYILFPFPGKYLLRPKSFLPCLCQLR